MKVRYWFLSLIWLLNACDSKDKGNGKDIATEASSTQTGSAAVTNSDAKLTSFTYDAATHSLLLGLEYAGCTVTQHSLVFSPVCAESYPRQCGATLTRPVSFDSSCRAIKREDLTVVLDTTQDEMVLTVSNSAGQKMQVLVDRTGRVAAATTPP